MANNQARELSGGMTGRPWTSWEFDLLAGSYLSVLLKAGSRKAINRNEVSCRLRSTPATGILTSTLEKYLGISAVLNSLVFTHYAAVGRHPSFRRLPVRSLSTGLPKTLSFIVSRFSAYIVSRHHPAHGVCRVASLEPGLRFA